MSASLKPSSQCAAAASKAMSALYRSRRTFKYINEESFKILYKTYIRPNLEFCIPAWCPYRAILVKRYQSDGKSAKTGHKNGSRIEEFTI